MAARKGKILGDPHQTFHRQSSQPSVTSPHLPGPMRWHDGARAGMMLAGLSDKQRIDDLIA
jgi:hypothetical protein